MARVVRPSAYGAPTVLEVEEVPTPSAAAAGHVVVRVHAAGVNPLDWKSYGVAAEPRDAGGVLPPPPGLECAGTVTFTGEGVEALEVGDEVIVFPAPGAYADYVEVPAHAVVAKPPGLGWNEAAGLLLSGTTAALALHTVRLQPGDTVIVHGGSGAVGLIAVQLAHRLGARVIATAAVRNHDLLRALGAEPVVYGEGLLERLRAAAPQGVDASVDTVGTEDALDTSVALVPDRDRIVSITGSARRAEAGIKLIGNGPGQDAGTDFRAAARATLVEQASAGDLRVFIAATFPLTDAAAADEFGMAGHDPGKVVLIP